MGQGARFEGSLTVHSFFLFSLLALYLPTLVSEAVYQWSARCHLPWGSHMAGRWARLWKNTVEGSEQVETGGLFQFLSVPTWKGTRRLIYSHLAR